MIFMNKQNCQFDRKIELKGKYLKPVADFVDALHFGNLFSQIVGLEESPIVEMIINLHGSHLSHNDAAGLIASELIFFKSAREGASGPLGDPANQAHRNALIDQLKTAIESLPRSYIVCIESPNFPAIWPGRIEITEDIAFVTGTRMALPRPKRPKDGILNATRERICFWEFRVKGYTSYGVHSAGITECLSRAKLIGFNLIRSGFFLQSSRISDISSSITDQLTGETFEFALPQALQYCLGSIFPRQPMAEPNSSIDEDGLDFLTDADRHALLGSTRELSTIKHNLAPIVTFFDAMDHPDFVSVCAAIEWYQDSRSAENQTFAYLAACIGLEAILGSDNTITGLSKRLADRYAFLLGKGRSERDRLSKEYETVLNVRGRLVHAKAARLTTAELAQLSTAQKMLARVIEHELVEILGPRMQTRPK
jgi:hypothetical protein